MDKVVAKMCEACVITALELYKLEPGHPILRYYVIKTPVVEAEFELRFCQTKRGIDGTLPKIKLLHFYQRYHAALVAQLLISKIKKKIVKKE